jgi:hypothetical protein
LAEGNDLAPVRKLPQQQQWRSCCYYYYTTLPTMALPFGLAAVYRRAAVAVAGADPI